MENQNSVSELICPKSDEKTKSHDEIDQIFSLYVEKEQWLKEQGINQWVDYTSDSRFPKRYFADKAQQGRLFAVKTDGKITAACVMTETDKEIWGELGTQPNIRYIKNFVSGAKGAGGNLLKHLESMCKDKDITALRLDCHNGNPALKDYYLKKGFTVSQIIEIGKLYKTDATCLMQKELL